MAAGKPVRISILADAKDAVKGFDKAGAAAKDAGQKFDGAAEGADTVASKGAQAAGALTGLGDLVGGKFGAGMAVAGTAMQAAADAGDLLNVAIEGGAKAAGKAVAFAQSLGRAETYAAAAKKASAIAQGALNVVMSANPIALVVIAIVALVAAFVIAYKKSETFRNIVNKGWATIKATGLAVFNFLKSFIPAAIAFIKNAFLKYSPLGIIISHFGQIKSFITGAWNTAKSITSSAWNSIKTGVSTGVTNVISYVRGIPGRVKSALGNVGSMLLHSGEAIMQGLADGIWRGLGRVTSAVQGVLQRARNMLPFSPAKEGPFSGKGWTLYSGRSIVEGLADGIKQKIAVARSAARSLAGSVADGFGSPELGISARTALAGSPGSLGGNTYRIDVSVPATANPAETGRAIVKAIDAYERSGGRRQA